MAFDTFKKAGTAILAVAVLAAGANAAELKLKSKSEGRMVFQPSASKVLKGNVPALPDLIVTPMTGNTSGMPNTGVCGNWSSGYVNVKFKVRNQGSVAADLTNLNITMQKNGQYVGGAVMQVPSLNPGQQTTITLPVPAEAQPGYSESIKVMGKVDASHYIQEMSETNNTHTGFCHGPTT